MRQASSRNHNWKEARLMPPRAISNFRTNYQFYISSFRTDLWNAFSHNPTSSAYLLILSSYSPSSSSPPPPPPPPPLLTEQCQLTVRASAYPARRRMYFRIGDRLLWVHINLQALQLGARFIRHHVCVCRQDILSKVTKFRFHTKSILSTIRTIIKFQWRNLFLESASQI